MEGIVSHRWVFVPQAQLPAQMPTAEQAHNAREVTRLPLHDTTHEMGNSARPRHKCMCLSQCTLPLCALSQNLHWVQNWASVADDVERQMRLAHIAGDASFLLFQPPMGPGFAPPMAYPGSGGVHAPPLERKAEEILMTAAEKKEASAAFLGGLWLIGEVDSAGGVCVCVCSQHERLQAHNKAMLTLQNAEVAWQQHLEVNA